MNASPAPESAPPVSLPEIAELAWEQSAAGLCAVDDAGIVRRANPAFAEVVGYSAEELVNMPLARLQPAVHAVEMQTLHRSIMQGGQAPEWAGQDTYFVNRRGRPITTYSRNARIVTAQGEVLRLITLIDLTDASRTDRRIDQIIRLENYTALSSMVSNALNNLFSIILGYTELLRDGGHNQRRQQVVADGVDGAVQRATSLVKQSLYMVRRPDPVRQKSDLGKFLENRLQVLRAEIGDRSVELELSLVDEMKEVPLDVVQMAEALGEIVRRLHVFEPDTSRGLRARTRWEAGSVVRTSFSQAGARAYAVIELTNPGRPRAGSRPPVLLDDAANEPRHHDLGHTLIERIVESHQGFLGYKSHPAGAATYTVWLPLGGEVEESDAPVSPRTVKSTVGKHEDITRTVLLVDDEQGLLSTMASSLRTHGYEVLTAHDGEAALVEYEEHANQLDLVIVDLVLPGMGGWEVFTHIRESTPELPVLIMSGHLEPKLEVAVNRSGAAGFLQKPFGLNMLLRRVQELVETKATVRQGN